MAKLGEECKEWLEWGDRVKSLYQPLKGFEHKTKPARVEGFKKILQTIVDHCGEVKGKTFLDIGANVGYFCFNLTDMGAQTIALERDKKRSSLSKCVAKKLNYSSVNPLFINKDAPEYVLSAKPNVDYVIFLNTFHHILVQNEKRAWEMFNFLINTSDGIFIMMRNQLREWRLCQTRVEIPEAVIAVSDATKYVSFPAVHGRVIYFFSK